MIEIAPDELADSRPLSVAERQHEDNLLIQIKNSPETKARWQELCDWIWQQGKTRFERINLWNEFQSEFNYNDFADEIRLSLNLRHRRKEQPVHRTGRLRSRP